MNISLGARTAQNFGPDCQVRAELVKVTEEGK
ncbi:hypothetical protein SIAM614_02311 [Stappia aggregata IAM 12614]|uniref:Uncharacterized protein n=1 Tax=Roseibium aggregatum (strain ATCC 25650 / DSM 13394 / JCM 20685 / NBRC 16684 / NCIMB 2208 / IAM 12614 / B1) TaxID=384765 RepID=A0NU71_ROSAI|nr:hypothetical protein SIAM614_02311 [Stappia aggregata IAM 12614] [Roseibium aggregatum IAM 12614]